MISTFRVLWLAVIYAFIGSGLLGSARAGAASPASASFEAQVEYLEGALAEGLRTRDWKMLELTVTGFKAAKLSPAALDLSALRAERLAALEALSSFGQP